ncbi:MAG: 2-C-methyl-D-erythritol 4-phosphate cytidylyltransferase [Elusimicrobiaceae bacterium]|nr:2-C-methyl-D-erythritol 4-phosphate cytidylyltransferase [Elusimicrobiaceae bacterium]
MHSTDQLTFAGAIIVAGGLGKRMGRPKQMLPLAGVPVLVRSVQAFQKIACVKQIVVVTSLENQEILKKYFSDLTFAQPGETRLGSVISGVQALDPHVQAIAVHDGARPLVNPSAAERCLQRGFTEEAAVLAVQVKDTIKQVGHGQVQKTLDRSCLWAAQTPQCYRADILRKALERFGYQQDATDESQLVERLGVSVKIEPSDYQNLKITTPEDLVMAEAFLQTGAQLRTGFGFDLHRMSAGRKFIIGGSEIPHSKGFVGHSDGDVVLHAICDAILGALCLGEIGLLFPPTDPTIEGIDSKEIAKKVLELVRAQGARLLHIDATLVTQEPKISPHYAQVKKSLAAVFEMDEKNVSFKSKSHEHVGEIGRGEAAMCHAVATLLVGEEK